MINKAIILAGGMGSRLYPLTFSVSKQLLPVFDKPMVYYPLSTLMLANIRDILIISTPEDVGRFEQLLGSGTQWGVNFTYLSQPSPGGLAQAFIIGEKFINNSPCALILGDNLFYGDNFQSMLLRASAQNVGATIFAYHVVNSQSFGVVEFDNKLKVLGIEEKPKNPKSNYAVTGLYFYDSNVCHYAKTLKPSVRDELEITDLNNIYLGKNELTVELLGRGYAWFDCGTHDSLLEASSFISSIEKRQGLKIACPEEIAWRKGWISSEKLEKQAAKFPNNPYGTYLKKILLDAV